LAVVASPFQASGQSANYAVASYIPHATAEAYGVGSDNATAMAALISEYYSVPFVAAHVEVKGS
jgi:hypothetical protein